MRAARRLDSIDPFYVMEVAKAAVRIAASPACAESPMIFLNVGEPDFTAAPLVVEAAERALRDGRTQYTEAIGLLTLRERISGWYASRFGLDIPASRIVVTAGASAALQLACMALIDPGDEVLLPDPSYACNRHFVAAVDARAVLLPAGPEDRFQLTAAAVEAAWTDRTRGVLLASPSNPTGTSIAPDEMGRIVAAVRARGGFTLVDEIYLGLSFDDRFGQSALVHDIDGNNGRSNKESSDGSNGRSTGASTGASSGASSSASSGRDASQGSDLISINSFSKYFNMTGWRLGWLVAPQSLMPAIERLAQNLFICPSAIAQHAALACFEPASIAEYERRRLEFKARRDFIVPALQGLGLPVPVMPDGAFYAWADCSQHSDSSWDLAFDLMERAHVALTPGRDFARADGERFLRLSYANSMPQLQEAVRRLARVLG